MKDFLIMKLHQLVIMLLNRDQTPDMIEREVEKSMPSQRGIYVLTHSRRFMKKFVKEKDGFYSNEVYYQDADSLYFHMGHNEN